MPDADFIILLCTAAFCGAVVSGLAGFAFSAVAGAILLHVMSPVEAVPLMMALSLPVQCATMATGCTALRWRACLPLICGGVAGVIPAVWLLQRIDTWPFRVAFGMLVAAYAGYMLFRPAMRSPRTHGALQTMLVGIGGGLIGGLTAMPGALPTIWGDLRGMPRAEQRALVQPYIVALQLFALAIMITRYGLSATVLIDLVVSLPALAAGTLVGLALYKRLKEFTFRRIVLGTLLFSGLTLVL